MRGWVHSLAVSQEEEKEPVSAPSQVPAPEQRWLLPRRANNFRSRAKPCSSSALNNPCRSRSQGRRLQKVRRSGERWRSTVKEYGVNSGIPFIKIADRVEVTVDLKMLRVRGPPLVFKQ